MASSTIFCVACRSWPCFLESSVRYSFSLAHSLRPCRIERVPTSTREVEARSAAWRRQPGSHAEAKRLRFVSASRAR